MKVLDLMRAILFVVIAMVITILITVAVYIDREVMLKLEKCIERDYESSTEFNSKNLVECCIRSGYAKSFCIKEYWK